MEELEEETREQLRAFFLFAQPDARHPARSDHLSGEEHSLTAGSGSVRAAPTAQVQGSPRAQGLHALGLFSLSALEMHLDLLLRRISILLLP